jgi:hypothetical protein
MTITIFTKIFNDNGNIKINLPFLFCDSNYHMVMASTKCIHLSALFIRYAVISKEGNYIHYFALGLKKNEGTVEVIARNEVPEDIKEKIAEIKFEDGFSYI